MQCYDCWFVNSMMTSSNVNIFRVTGHLCGEFTGNRLLAFVYETYLAYPKIMCISIFILVTTTLWDRHPHVPFCVAIYIYIYIYIYMIITAIITVIIKAIIPVMGTNIPWIKVDRDRSGIMVPPVHNGSSLHCSTPPRAASCKITSDDDVMIWKGFPNYWPFMWVGESSPITNDQNPDRRDPGIASNRCKIDINNILFPIYQMIFIHYNAHTYRRPL